MSSHDLWHVAVLGSTLFAGAGLAILGLSPLLFDEPPPGLTAARPLILSACGLAAILLLAEWLGVH